mgnify:CR=1 FL=1
MGAAETYSVTTNGQYVFTMMSRPRWALFSMERIVQVCAYLKDHPNDPFLSQWRSACHNSPPPRYPAVTDFLQIASACLPGTYCPSFETEIVTEVPPGHYSDFHFNLDLCEPGYMCIAGRRQECPIGFMCPEPGTSIPQRCPVDPTLSTTCYKQGLPAPQPCPNGTLCGAPYLPPIPAPPGTLQTTVGSVARAANARPGAAPNAFHPHSVSRVNHVASALPAGASSAQSMFLGQRRTLQACERGDYCNLGMSTSLPASDIQCPADFFCANSSVMRPVLCNFGGTCNSSACPDAPYCPAGAFAELWWG